MEEIAKKFGITEKRAHRSARSEWNASDAAAARFSCHVLHPPLELQQQISFSEPNDPGRKTGEADRQQNEDDRRPMNRSIDDIRGVK